MSLFSGKSGTWVETEDYGAEHESFGKYRNLIDSRMDQWFSTFSELDNTLGNALENFTGVANTAIDSFIDGGNAMLKDFKQNWQPTAQKYNQMVRSAMDPGRWKADAAQASQDQMSAADQAYQQYQRELKSKGVNPADAGGAMANNLNMMLQKNANAAMASTNQYNDSQDRALALGGAATEYGDRLRQQGLDNIGTAADVGSILQTSTLNNVDARDSLQYGINNFLGMGADLTNAQAALRGREYDERMSSNQFKQATKAPSGFEALAGAGIGAFTGNFAGAGGAAAGNKAFAHDGGAIPEDVNPRSKTSPPTGPEIQAILEEGEYVIPKEVVQIKGTEFFDRMVGKYAPDKAANQAIPAGVPRR